MKRTIIFALVAVVGLMSAASVAWGQESPRWLRKNAIYGFLPGSMFSKEANSPCVPIGKIVDLKPDMGEESPEHPVWRNGKAIMLPINIK